MTNIGYAIEYNALILCNDFFHSLSINYRNPNSLNREQSFDLYGTSMAFDKLGSKMLKFPHDQKIVIETTIVG